MPDDAKPSRWLSPASKLSAEATLGFMDANRERNTLKARRAARDRFLDQREPYDQIKPR